MRHVAALRHPAVITALVLAALTAVWSLIGSPILLITQIAIYALYGAGVNLLVGYTGLAPFERDVQKGGGRSVIAGNFGLAGSARRSARTRHGERDGPPLRYM